jgi:hypothetical protein
MVRGFAGRVKPPTVLIVAAWTAEVTLLLGDLRVANIGEKSGVGGATTGVGLAGFGKAQMAIHGKSDFVGVGVVLPVVLPPANGTQPHRVRFIEGLISATWAPVLSY